MSNSATLLTLALLLAGCTALPASIAGDVERGGQLFSQGQGDAPPCSTCHQTVTGQSGFTIGPNLDGVGERASTRVVGMTAVEYLRQSILDPRRHVVTGYRNIMYPDYSTHLTQQNLDDLVAYLLTL